MTKKNVCISAYMDPLHKGHIELITKAKALCEGGKLIVIVNNDEQAIMKKGKYFMTCDERVKIIEALRDVDVVIKSLDTDRTVCKTLEHAHLIHTVDIFANGGDQFNEIIPERAVCEQYGIQLVDGLGAKIQSSSWLTGIKP